MDNEEEKIVPFNRETGEIIEGIAKSNERISKEKERAIINSNRKQNKFTNTNMDKIDFISEKLTHAQLGHLMMLHCYIYYDGRLIHSQKNKSSLKRSDLDDLLGMAKRTRNNFLKICIDNGIIYEDEDENLSVNTSIIFKGVFRKMNVVSTVTNELEEIRKKIKPTELGILLKLQKFVHYESMALVKNPQEKDPSKLEVMELEDIAEALDLTYDHTGKVLKRLKYGRNFAIAQVRAGNQKTYMLNPAVFFRGDYSDVQKRIAHPNSIYFINRKKQ